MSYRFSEGVQNSPIGAIDRSLGFAFGVIRGLFVVGLAYLAFSMMVPVRTQPEWLTGAHLLPLIQSSSDVILSLAAGQHAVLYATVTTEAFAQGLADAAFLTFLSALCAREFAATQYALLSSVPQLAIHTIGGASGVMAASLGWTLFYAVCMAGALPGQ